MDGVNAHNGRVGRSAQLPGWALLLAVSVLVMGCSAPSNGRATVPSGSQEAAVPDPATQRLWDAIAAGDHAAALAAIADGAELEARDGTGGTPLIAATKAERTDLALALLEAGADPNAKDDIQDSAYLYAGARGLNEILLATLEHGADVTSTNRYGGTALIPASERGQVETVRILLAAGVDVNHINRLNWTALHEAIVLGDGSAEHIEVVRLLLDGGADPTIPDGEGVLPRDLAASRGYHAMVTLIDEARG